ncbi:YjbH domain-containing protein, partial [Maritalea sp.]|uniref:YjbH domain-containing protein n=1 Tax=Maritalea sp. TaxID=2003361 RepID=UPI003EF69EFC
MAAKFILWSGLTSILLSATYTEAAELDVPVSVFGTPGLIDMPTGEVFTDGQVILTTDISSIAQKYTLSFQITPRMFGSFRYSIIDDYDGVGNNRYDRSFDFGYLLLKESEWRPSVAIGLRDFGGTGLYSSEYIAATKHLANNSLSITGGIGWGRLGSYGSFSNPLSIFSDIFDTRGDGPTSISEVGQLEIDQWFRGDAALFGGVAWQINDRIAFKVEYSSDAYTQETSKIGFEHKSPINAALSYGFQNGADVSVYSLYGSEFGIMGSIALSPQNPKFPSGIEEAPSP